MSLQVLWSGSSVWKKSTGEVEIRLMTEATAEAEESRGGSSSEIVRVTWRIEVPLAVRAAAEAETETECGGLERREEWCL